jgi:hypothetical protein
MNFPSLVRFFWGRELLRDLDELREVAEALRGGGPYGEGSEEEDVRA